MRRLAVGLRDVRLAIGVVVGMLLAGVVLPLASPERDGTAALATGGPGVAATRSGSGTAGAGSNPGAGSAGGAPGAAGGAPGAPGAAGGAPGAAGGGGADATAPGGGGSEERTASDVGVTPDTIRLGVALVNLDTLSRAGVGASNGTVADRTRVWEALVADANANGGAAGRQIELAVDDFDPLDTNAAPQVCRRLAEDQQVFAVVSDVGWSEPGALCVTRQYGRPNIGYDAQDITTYADSGGLLFTSMASNDRILYNHVQTLHERGLLEGRTIGLVTFEGLTGAFERTEIPALEALGYEITHRSPISRDLSTAQSQIPIEVNQMRTKGVDFIIFEGGPTTLNFWVNQAQQSGYNPTYSVSDFGSDTDDFSVQTVTQQMDAYGWGTRRRHDRRGSDPEAETDAACVQRASAATGLAMPRDGDLYWNTVVFCAALRAFVDAANAAGANPTAQSFAAAFGNFGQRPDIEAGPGGVGGSFGPGKPDAPDFLRMLRHDVSCRCWRPEGDWFPMRPLGE